MEQWIHECTLNHRVNYIFITIIITKSQRGDATAKIILYLTELDNYKKIIKMI